MNDLFTPEQAQVLMNFLNRVEITGHVERNSMNFFCMKLQMLITPAPPINTPEDEDDGKEINPDETETDPEA